MSYFKQLVNAILGKAQPPMQIEPPQPPPSAVRLAPEQALPESSRIAALEMDLRERNERIAAMQKEFTNLEEAANRSAAGAGAEQLEQLFKRLSAPLSNLDALLAIADEGREVTVGDLANLVRSVERQLKAAGLERVGEVGAQLPFDLVLHQRMSGGAVSEGAAVTVRTPGYRFGEKILLKAMVTAKETTNE